MASKRVVLMAPGTVKGFMSACAPMALGPGVASRLYDVRLDDRTVRTRWGSVAINAAIHSTDTFRGCFECVQNGVTKLFVALSDGTNHVTIYQSTDVGATWTVVTPSSGAYGDTRLTDVGPVFFVLVTNQGTDYLVVQNGVDNPRLYSGSAVAINTNIALSPNSVLSVAFVSSLIWAAVNTTVANSHAAGLAGSVVTNSVGTHAEIVITNAVVPSTTTALHDNAVFISTGGTFLSTPGYTGQFVWLVDEPTQAWRNLKIEVQDGSGAWYSLYDPAVDAPVTAATTSGTAMLVAVNTLSRSPDSTQPFGGVVAFRCSWFGGVPAANITIKLYTMAAGGYRLGGTAYGDSFASSSSLALGPANILTNPVTPVYSGITLPISGLFGYVYTITTTMPAVLQPGVTSLNFYRSDLGTTSYYQYNSTNVSPSTTRTIDDGNSPDFLGGNTINFSLPMNPGGTRSIPIGTGMASVNDRLMVCAGSRFWYSEATQPYLFSQNVRFASDGSPVSTSGGSFQKPGETFQNVVAVGQLPIGTPLGTPQIGSVAVYVLTDRKTYLLSGFDALSLNKTTGICMGTRCPMSVGVTTGGFSFLDTQLQIRHVVGSQSQALSKYTVDDQTRGIPNARLKWVSGVFIDERYYLAYTPMGGSANTRILIYNESIGWESIDRPQAPCEGLLPFYDASAGRTRLLAFSPTTLFEHAPYGQSTEVGGASIAARVVLSEMTNGAASVTYGTGVFMTDPDPTGTITLTVNTSTGERVPSVVYPPLSLAARRAGELRVGARTETGVGADPLTAQAQLDILAVGGTRVYRFELEMHPGSEQIDP